MPAAPDAVSLLDSIQKILHWISPRFMLFILILSLALFFMPPTWAAYLSLDGWISHHKTWMGLGMVVGAVYLIPFGVAPPFEKWHAAHSFNKKTAHIMSKLTPDEKRTLRRFYFPSQSGHIIVWRHEIGKLESDGILFRPGDSGLKNNQEVFSLTATALKYIEKHPEFIADLEKINPSPF